MKSFRIKFFYMLLNPFSEYMRNKRMKGFIYIMKPFEGMRVLDLGGQPQIWDSVSVPLKITCLNLPGIAEKNHITHHSINYVIGDACSMPEFKKGDFDLIYSNSVIEHVGDKEKRQSFANEVKRLSDKYWIQTPSIWFPIEAHCGMPFWWFYPKRLQQYFLHKWGKNLPKWTDMVRSTTVVRRKELVNLFPEAKLKTEWFGLPKSLIVFSD